MKVIYRQTARNDVISQFRYYLMNANVPEVALRFRSAVRLSASSLRDHPLMGPRYPLRNSLLQSLRSWPVAGFETIHIYYLLDSGTIHIIRILHQNRDVRRILEQETAME